ncbi:hypothetical protein BZG36_05463 [Bifiguratus adelaidae]|uniref:glucan 1,3-beta-glucosidase n=1 Tax=Bifiguratus adelaidae TaxID=1938954 RepID=A0A261XT32_9FUNG|nr:hypothetical protein BZG36_05463 [Bifiguratus adelaidae]
MKHKWLVIGSIVLGAIATVLLVVLLVYFLYVKPRQQGNNDSDYAIPPVPNDPHPDDSAAPNNSTPPLDQPFRYGFEPIRGVNLGGWLVLEPFITPSLFTQFDPKLNVRDEWSFCTALGPEEARRQLIRHYDTFVTEADFKHISELGLNHVRIPIGHWAIETQPPEPYVEGVAWNFLLRALNWARKYGIRVMIDLHTAPGSQNGFNHSGHSGKIGFLKGVSGTTNGNRTTTILVEMTRRLNQHQWANVVPLFDVLNEPAIIRMNKTVVGEWYKSAYAAVRAQTGCLGGFMPQPPFENVMLDLHPYYVFDRGLMSIPYAEKLTFPCTDWRRSIINATKHFGPTIVGEFTSAFTDWGPYLNGIVNASSAGARWDGTLNAGLPPICPNCTCADETDYASWTDSFQADMRTFVERQMDAYEMGWGWFFWNFKTEYNINPHWDYFLDVDGGWIPQDAGARLNACAAVLNNQTST